MLDKKMPYNVLLLPLLGGYIFISIYYPTRYYALRSDGYQLLLHSAIAGVFSLLISEILVLFLASMQPFSYLHTWWVAHIEFPYSGRALLSFFLGFISLPLNLVRDKQSAFDRVLSQKGDPLELMLRKAMYETKPVSLSLKSGKNYVGFVTYAIFTTDPSFPIRSVKILPLLSGYREGETLGVRFTTNYSPVYEKIRAGDGHFDNWSVDDFEIVIPIEEIQTANIFNMVAYRDYFHPEE